MNKNPFYVFYKYFFLSLYYKCAWGFGFFILWLGNVFIYSFSQLSVPLSWYCTFLILLIMPRKSTWINEGENWFSKLCLTKFWTSVLVYKVGVCSEKKNESCNFNCYFKLSNSVENTILMGSRSFQARDHF